MALRGTFLFGSKGPLLMANVRFPSLHGPQPVRIPFRIRPSLDGTDDPQEPSIRAYRYEWSNRVRDMVNGETDIGSRIDFITDWGPAKYHGDGRYTISSPDGEITAFGRVWEEDGSAER